MMKSLLRLLAGKIGPHHQPRNRTNGWWNIPVQPGAIPDLQSLLYALIPIATYLLGLLTRTFLGVTSDKVSTRWEDRYQTYIEVGQSVDGLTDRLMDPEASLEFIWSDENTSINRSNIRKGDQQALNTIGKLVDEFARRRGDLGDRFSSVNKSEPFPDAILDLDAGEPHLVVGEGEAGQPITISVQKWLCLFGLPLIRAEDADDLRHRVRAYARQHGIEDYDGTGYWDEEFDAWAEELWESREKRSEVWRTLLSLEQEYQDREEYSHRIASLSNQMRDVIFHKRTKTALFRRSDSGRLRPGKLVSIC